MMYSLDRPSARVIGGDEDDDTIELELNESAIRALTEAAALAQAATEATQAREVLEQETQIRSQGTASFVRPPRKSRRFVRGLGMAAAVTGLLGGLAYLATARARHPISIVADSGSHPLVAPEAPTLAPEPTVTPDVPVRFKNPFDASEVFEFPAGTSQTEVRDAVAELLSQRARERQSLFVKRPQRNTKTADRDASVTASRITPRS